MNKIIITGIATAAIACQAAAAPAAPADQWKPTTTSMTQYIKSKYDVKSSVVFMFQSRQIIFHYLQKGGSLVRCIDPDMANDARCFELTE